MQPIYDASLCAATDEMLVAMLPDHRFAFHELLRRYERLVYHVANGLATNPQDAEDFAEEGLLGLVAAAAAYTEEHKASFRTFATVCIRNRIRNAYAKIPREQGGRNNQIPLSVEEMEEEVSAQLCDPEGSPETIFLQKERVTELYREMADVLTKQEMEIFCLYVSDHSYAAIASKLEISVKSVDNAIQRARRKLRAVWSKPSEGESIG